MRKTLTISINKEEQSQLEARAASAGVTMGQYCKRAALEQTIGDNGSKQGTMRTLCKLHSIIAELGLQGEPKLTEGVDELCQSLK